MTTAVVEDHPVTDLLLNRPEGRAERIVEARTRVNDFLRDAVAAVRERFPGRITYACIPFERVDWTLFDIVSVELIRSAEVADRYQEGVRTLVAQGKPVAITGFGTATWRGSGDVAPHSMEILEHDETGRPVRLKGDYVRDEAGQATYLRELLEIFDAEGVDRFSKTATATPTPTCRGNPRPPSPPSPTTTAADQTGSARYEGA